MSVLSTTLVLGQGGRWEFSMPSPGRVSPICSSQEQAERDCPWRSFTPPLRFPPANWGDFLPWKSHSWNLHPFLPLLLFLACLASSFFLAQPFANLSTDGKVHSKVTWIVWKTSTLHPSVLPQQILVFTLLGSVLLRPWPLQVFCLCYLRPQNWLSLPWSSDLGLRVEWWLNNSATTLKPTDLYTLKGELHFLKLLWKGLIGPSVFNYNSFNISEVPTQVMHCARLWWRHT